MELTLSKMHLDTLTLANVKKSEFFYSDIVSFILFVLVLQ